MLWQNPADGLPLVTELRKQMPEPFPSLGSSKCRTSRAFGEHSTSPMAGDPWELRCLPPLSPDFWGRTNWSYRWYSTPYGSLSTTPHPLHLSRGEPPPRAARRLPFSTPEAVPFQCQTSLFPPRTPGWHGGLLGEEWRFALGDITPMNRRIFCHVFSCRSVRWTWSTFAPGARC